MGDAVEDRRDAVGAAQGAAGHARLPLWRLRAGSGGNEHKRAIKVVRFRVDGKKSVHFSCAGGGCGRKIREWR
jgi:hypothetical protein